MRDERTISTKEVYHGRLVKLRVDRVETPDGKKTTREIVEHSDCVAIVALDKENNVLLVRQFRQPVGKELLEIPAGGIDRNEDVTQAVCRELQEETGYFPQKLEKLGGFYSAPGYCTEYLHLYMATDLTYRPLKAEDTDSIELIRAALVSIPELIASGEICDAKSITGLLIVYHMNDTLL